MRIGELSGYIERHYFSPRREERRYGLLVLGAPGVGKTMGIEEGARRIAEKLKLIFTKVTVRWSPKLRKFVIDTTGEHEIEKVLTEADKHFVYTRFLLSTIEPSDLSGIPRSHEGITFYDPLLWAVIHSAAKGIVFLDEITWIQREDVWAIVPQLVLDKVAGLTSFHPETLVVAAGNRPEDASTIVRLLHNPLLNRFKVFSVASPTVEEWGEWMVNRYGDAWDKRALAFLMRFRDEGYILQIPSTPEGLEQYPTPRSWTWISLDLNEEFNALEDLHGLLGSDVGSKFWGFLQVNVDLDELLRKPELFAGLSLDGRYMASIMLSSWVSKNASNPTGCFPLIDAMSKASKEFLVLSSMGVPTAGNRRKTFLSALFRYRKEYMDVMSEIIIDMRSILAA